MTVNKSPEAGKYLCCLCKTEPYNLFELKLIRSSISSTVQIDKCKLYPNNEMPTFFHHTLYSELDMCEYSKRKVVFAL